MFQILEEVPLTDVPNFWFFFLIIYLIFAVVGLLFVYLGKLDSKKNKNQKNRKSTVKK